MNARNPTAHERILVVGRSPNVLIETVELLRSKGFVADATNQFDSVLNDYDVTRLDILVFGGMVPHETKRYLRDHVEARNPNITFIQGLAGIPGLIAAQVVGAVGGTTVNDHLVAYDPSRRVVQVNLDEAAKVTIDAYWATSFTPPEPQSTSMQVIDAELEVGSTTVTLPAEIPAEASYLTVAVGATVQAFTVGPMPQAVPALVPTGDPGGPVTNALPAVAAVSTHSPD